MSDLIKKGAVVDMLTALENDFQQYKPFQGNEEAMYRKVCEVEMAIGKMDPFMKKIVDVNDCDNMLGRALIENANMAEKIEMQENCIDEQRKQIENQQKAIEELEKKLKELKELQAAYDWLKNEADILEAQMEVVRMIFGGKNE